MENITRKVLIWNTRGQSRQVITTSATTFGQLKKEAGLDIDYSSYRIMEGNSMLSFDNDEAVLPNNIRTPEGTTTNDLTIVISPSKKISSGMPLGEVRQALMDELKMLITKYGAPAKNHFGNYTRISNAELFSLIKSFKAPQSNPVTSVPAASVDFENNTLNIVLTIKVQQVPSTTKLRTDFDLTETELAAKYSK